MRNLKRVLSLALACVMVIGMMVMTTGAADFADADEITNVEAVEVMSALGILEGYNGEFNPNGTLTRGQAAKIVAYMLLGEDTAEKLVGSGAFTDTVGHWADPYISYCSNLKIVAGYGDGNFGPDDLLTDLAFGKMVMVALGESAAQFEGDSWATVTGAAMIEMGLVRTATGANISRDAASALALEGLKYSDTPDTYQLVDGNGDAVAEFDTLLDATLYNTILNNAYTVRETPASDCLLTEVHNTTWVRDVDAMGRTANVYSNDDWIAPLTIVTAKPVATFDSKVMKTTGISAKLASYKQGGNKISATYKVTADTDLTIDEVYVDGVKTANYAMTLNVGDYLADGFKALTDNAATVEIYADINKNITKVVIVNTYADVVESFTKADADTETPAYVTLKNSGLTFVTEDFAKDDVVLYTKSAGEVASMELAKSFTGTLESYTNGGTYTIDGVDYQLAGNANVVTGITGASITPYYDEEAVYYLGRNNKIVYVTDVEGAAVVTAGYAKIVDSIAKAKTDNFGTATSMEAQVKVVLSNGTQATYDLPVYKVGGSYYTYFNGAYSAALANNSAVTGLTADDIYTYALDGNTISLVEKVDALSGTEAVSGAAAITTDANLTKASTSITISGKTVILNENTVFVLKKGAGTVVKTGIAALEGTTVTTGAEMVVNVACVKVGGNTVRTNVAAVVFAETVSFSESVTTGVNDYIYVDGSYVVTKDAQGNFVYTATGIKADGSEISVTKGNVPVKGIYKFDSNGDVDGNQLGTVATVGTIAGTTYELGNGVYKTINDSTKIVIVAPGAKLEKDAEVTYVLNGQNNSIVSLIYVTKAAD